MMKFVVVVDQSEPPGSLNGLNAFGPFTKMTAESIMYDINGEAMSGNISIGSVAVIPIYEGTRKLNDIVRILHEQV